MPFDLSSPQLDVWMAVSTRPDVAYILLRDPMVYTPQETQFLLQVGIDTTDLGVIAMVQASTPYKQALASAAGHFHAIMQIVLKNPYPPPNCPADAQLNCLSRLLCQQNTSETEFNNEYTALMAQHGPPILAPLAPSSVKK